MTQNYHERDTAVIALATPSLHLQGELFSTSFSYLLRAVSASPTEKVMHAIHEAVGWAVLALVAAVLALGGARTYFSHTKTEIELAAVIEKNPLLKTLRNLHRSYFGPAYRKVFVVGAIGLCSNIYRRFEVGVVDRLNYAAASAVRELSVLLYRYVDVASIDGLNYMVAGATMKLSDRLFKYAELSGIDKFNYLVADGAVGMSSRFRKTHTGVLSYNMILVGFTFIAFLVFSLYIGGFLR